MNFRASFSTDPRVIGAVAARLIAAALAAGYLVRPSRGEHRSRDGTAG